MESPSYYGIVPANIRYDPDICPNAKLLYAEITALANKEGFCYASNSYFAKLYRVKPTTVSDWVAQLRDAGHITMTIEDKNKRKIYIAVASGVPNTQPDPSGKTEGGFGKSRRGVSEKAEHNNTSIIINNNSELVSFITKLSDTFKTEYGFENTGDWYKLKPQREAADRLLTKFGADRCIKRLKLLAAYKTEYPVRKLTTPFMLDALWDELSIFWDNKKGSAESINNNVFILK